MERGVRGGGRGGVEGVKGCVRGEAEVGVEVG